MDLRLVDNAGIVMVFAMGERLSVVSAPQGPPLSLPDDLTVEAAGAAGTRVAYTASVACTPASGSVFPIGHHHRHLPQRHVPRHRRRSHTAGPAAAVDCHG